MATIISDIIRARAETGLADLLLLIYDSAYCAGANLPSESPADPILRDLLSTIAGRHRAEILTFRGWCDPPILADDLPGWLLTLKQQAETIEPPSVDGWPI